MATRDTFIKKPFKLFSSMAIIFHTIIETTYPPIYILPNQVRQSDQKIW